MDMGLSLYTGVVTPGTEGGETALPGDEGAGAVWGIRGREAYAGAGSEGNDASESLAAILLKNGST